MSLGCTQRNSCILGSYMGAVRNFILSIIQGAITSASNMLALCKYYGKLTLNIFGPCVVGCIILL